MGNHREQHEQFIVRLQSELGIHDGWPTDDLAHAEERVLSALNAALEDNRKSHEAFVESQAIIKDRDAEIEEAWKEANAAGGPLALAIYTTDDGRITSVVERDVDGDPCDREIDATAVTAHVEHLVDRAERAERLSAEMRSAVEKIAKEDGSVGHPGEAYFKYHDAIRIARAALATAPLPERTPRPKRIVLCGSSRFCEVMAVCAWLLERDEGAITSGLHLLPAWYPTAAENHLAEAEGCAARMDELHLRKIDQADEVFVVDYASYVGESTFREIEYATSLGKPVRWFTGDPVGDRVKAMIKDALAANKEVLG